jgi:hypothetical protein
MNAGSQCRIILNDDLEEAEGYSGKPRRTKPVWFKRRADRGRNPQRLEQIPNALMVSFDCAPQENAALRSGCHQCVGNSLYFAEFEAFGAKLDELKKEAET